MPRALPPEIRLDIVRRHLKGQALPQSATELRLSSDTVRALWRAYRDSGEQGLALRSHARGRSTPSTPKPILDMACQLKHDHPTWGPAGSVWNGSATSCRTRSPRRACSNGPSGAPESTGHGGLAGRRGREGPARHRGGGELEPDLALWLLGLGVELAWIPPSRPRHNGKVERCKGVTQLWAEPSARGSRSVSQAQLHRECLIQREKSPSIAGRPRIEAFPGLCRIERPDRADEEDRCWELSHVDRFLGEVVLYRRAHARGAIGLYGWGRGLGRIHRGKEICMRFDTSSCYCIISDYQGQELKRLPAEELSRERIIALEVGRQRAHRQKSKTRG